MISLSFSKALSKPIKNKSKKLFLMTTVSALSLLLLLAPETFATATATETAMDGQLAKVTKLASGGIAKTGLMVGTICSAVMGLFKNSWMIFLSSIGIGLGLSYYLEYLKVWGT